MITNALVMDILFFFLSSFRSMVQCTDSNISMDGVRVRVRVYAAIAKGSAWRMKWTICERTTDQARQYPVGERENEKANCSRGSFIMKWNWLFYWRHDHAIHSRGAGPYARQREHTHTLCAPATRRHVLNCPGAGLSSHFFFVCLVLWFVCIVELAIADTNIGAYFTYSFGQYMCVCVYDDRYSTGHDAK